MNDQNSDRFLSQRDLWHFSHFKKSYDNHHHFLTPSPPLTIVIIIDENDDDSGRPLTWLFGWQVRDMDRQTYWCQISDTYWHYIFVRSQSLDLGHSIFMTGAISVSVKFHQYASPKRNIPRPVLLYSNIRILGESVFLPGNVTTLLVANAKWNIGCSSIL